MARSLAIAALSLAASVGVARAEGHDGETTASVRVFAQPASGDALLVVTPSASATVDVTKWLRADASWLADVVTGATPRTYGKPDVVSSATQFNEVRHNLSLGATAKWRDLEVNAGYSYGTEHDYRSHLLRVGLRGDFLQHNLVVVGDYVHSWDSICDLNQSAVPILLRQPLDSSTGCFTGIPQLTEHALQTDTTELSLALTPTRKLVVALVGYYQHSNGFQSSPYRRVSLDNGLHQAQESHPLLRDRGALTLRLRRAVPSWRASLGLDARLYRDSWGIDAATVETLYEQPLTDDRRWRFGARVRGHVQSGAVFFRDLGDKSSYESAGPVGQYFTADQELAPLADLLVGAHFTHVAHATEDGRVWWLFADLETTMSLDYLKIFALSPDPPNVARIDAWATALVFGLSLAGRW